MNLLFDTHLLLWAAAGPAGKLPAVARQLLLDQENVVMFSVASLWEVAIKQSLGREDFQVDVSVLRRGLIDNNYLEVPILGAHAAALATLPPLHKDPFDRMLLAQSRVEGITLVTSDVIVAGYPGTVLKV